MNIDYITDLFNEYNLFVSIGIICLAWLFISYVFEKYRQSLRDKAAHAVLDNCFNYTKEHSDIITINEAFFDKKTEDICPLCNGLLETKYGPFSEFLGCTNYPDCEYKR